MCVFFFLGTFDDNDMGMKKKDKGYRLSEICTYNQSEKWCWRKLECGCHRLIIAFFWFFYKYLEKKEGEKENSQDFEPKE